MRDSLSTVLENRDLGQGIFLLRLRDPDLLSEPLGPGCFVMLATAPGLSPILRRPFSVQRVRDDVYDVLYRVVGEGTQLMSELRPGTVLRSLGPLGTHFNLPQPGETAILLGGGVGIPPMVALADALEAQGHQDWQAFLGVASASEQGCWVGFDEAWGTGPAAERIHRATMDGSMGFHGHVVAAFEDWNAGIAAGRALRLYACGPLVMLQAVARLAATQQLPAQVSVETMMGCGVGICMGCVIENADARNEQLYADMSPYDRWMLVCRKGPVFDANSIILEGGSLH
ncbi:MAG: hypothetical protein CMP23_09080 [Rickettsiales bacterium]|nr:hypothetical protein [Rickettsiales bacterium]|tara:strand:+ start:6852 stop:7709 length:858 start_codon:yes stop_codon:yes gene_type:complete